ncbi:LysR family transcriptional regulator [Parasphingorhabdus sp.]|uniref:LysR family transcriptional regulator n=1 Tax=Parasphingorhabdus sp. TaxID=2709688 RepID=UPI003262DDF2
MRLRQIEIFYHVFREGSISGAARVLHVSQPSVSKVLRHAEDQLGFALFYRKKGKLSPTSAAIELFADAENIYGQIGALNRAASNIRNRKGGHIRLGVLPSLSLTVIPDWIARLRKDDPQLSFEITTLHSDEMDAALLEKKCDLCIGFEASDDERLVSRNLSNAELVLITQPGQLDAKDGKVDLSVLHEADFVGLKDSGPAGTALTERLEKEAITPNEVVTTHTYYVAASLVRLGVGISVVDRFTANSFMAENLEKHEFSTSISHPVCAISHVDGHQPEILAACLTAIESLISN